MSAGTRLFARSPRVAHRRVDENRVLVLARTGEVVVINEAGGVLWDALAEARSLDALARTLAAAFELDEAQARRDATAFLEDMVARGALVVTGEAP